jgi:hypothetical protein
MPVSVLNTTASLSGKTLLKAEDAQTITGQKTFDVGGSAPFACVSGSALVTHLDADLLDGQHGTDYRDGEKLTNDVRLQGFSTAALVAKQSIAGEARLSYDSTTKAPKVSMNAGAYVSIFNAINVKQYGATGDGVTDDRAAIQAAIDAASATVAGKVFFPEGSYKVEKTPAQVYALLITKAIHLVGASFGGVTIRGHGMVAGDKVINIDGTVNPNLEHVHLSELTVMSNDAGRPDLITVNRMAAGSLVNIRLIDGRHGIILTGDRTYSLVLSQIHCTSHLTGDAIRFVTVSGGQFSFTDCSFNGANGLTVNGGSLSIDDLVFNNCNWEACDVVASIQTTGLVRGIVFNGGRCEKNLAPFDFSPGVAGVVLGVVFNGMVFETDVENYAINVSGSGSVAGLIVQGCYAKDYAQYFVRLIDGEGGQIIGNVLEAVPAVVNDYTRAGMLVLNNRTETGAVLGPQWGTTWTTPAFDAANFTAGGTQTWTVAAGDVAVYRYQILGKMMTVAFRIITSSVGGVADASLRLAIPASQVATTPMENPITLVDNGAAKEMGVASVAASGTYITLQMLDGATWAAAANTTEVYGQITFEIDTP